MKYISTITMPIAWLAAIGFTLVVSEVSAGLAVTNSADVVIYGARPAGSVAVFAADRAGASVVLLEHGRILAA